MVNWLGLLPCIQSFCRPFFEAWKKFKSMFQIRVFLLIRNDQKIRIRSGKSGSGSMNKKCKYKYKKLKQKTDGSGSGFLKSRSGSPKKTGSIRIRHNDLYCRIVMGSNESLSAPVVVEDDWDQENKTRRSTSCVCHRPMKLIICQVFTISVVDPFHFDPAPACQDGCSSSSSVVKKNFL